MIYEKSRRKEIETIKERTIEIKLSDADVQRLWEKSGSVGITVAELLENFIGDLVDGTYSNGSDEGDLANEWFDRCGFGMFPEDTFLSYLIQHENIEDFMDLFNDIEDSEKIIAIKEEEIKTGVIKGQAGSIYTWKDLTISSAEGDKPCYFNKEEWEIEQRGYIDQEKECITDFREQIEDYWSNFQEFTSEKIGTREEEFEKVLKWYKEMKYIKDGSGK